MKQSLELYRLILQLTTTANAHFLSQSLRLARQTNGATRTIGREHSVMAAITPKDEQHSSLSTNSGNFFLMNSDRNETRMLQTHMVSVEFSLLMHEGTGVNASSILGGKDSALLQLSLNVTSRILCEQTDIQIHLYDEITGGVHNVCTHFHKERHMLQRISLQVPDGNRTSIDMLFADNMTDPVSGNKPEDEGHSRPNDSTPLDESTAIHTEFPLPEDQGSDIAPSQPGDTYSDDQSPHSSNPSTVSPQETTTTESPLPNDPEMGTPLSTLSNLGSPLPNASNSSQLDSSVTIIQGGEHNETDRHDMNDVVDVENMTTTHGEVDGSADDVSTVASEQLRPSVLLTQIGFVDVTDVEVVLHGKKRLNWLSFRLQYTASDTSGAAAQETVLEGRQHIEQVENVANYHSNFSKQEAVVSAIEGAIVDGVFLERFRAVEKRVIAVSKRGEELEVSSSYVSFKSSVGETHGFHDEILVRPLHPVRVLGIALFIFLATFTSFMFCQSEKRKRRRTADLAHSAKQSSLATEKGLADILDAAQGDSMIEPPSTL